MLDIISGAQDAIVEVNMPHNMDCSLDLIQFNSLKQS